MTQTLTSSYQVASEASTGNSEYVEPGSGNSPRLAGRERAYGVIRDHWDALMDQRDKCEHIDAIISGEALKPIIPAVAPPDIHALAEMATSNFAGAVGRTFVQDLYVSGYGPSQSSNDPIDLPSATELRNSGMQAYIDRLKRRSVNGKETAKVWDLAWQRNGFDRRQTPIYLEAINKGVCYVGQRLIPERRQTKEGSGFRVKYYAITPNNGIPIYSSHEDADDEYPTAFLHIREEQDRGGSTALLVWVWLPDGIYSFESDQMPTAASDKDLASLFSPSRSITSKGLLDADLRAIPDDDENRGFIPYNSEAAPLDRIVPVSEFTCEETAAGFATGRIDELEDVLRRIVQDVFDRLVVQKKASWRKLWATGVQAAKSEAEDEALKDYIAVEDVLTSDSPDSKFGAFPATELDGFFKSLEEDLRNLSAISQLAPHYFLGISPNVGAEGLAEAQASKAKAVFRMQNSFGESNESNLRMSALLLGIEDEQADYSSEVWWRDTEVRSLSQAADAVGKLIALAGVPEQLAWRFLPNWSHNETLQGLALKAEDSLADQLRDAYQADFDDYQSGKTGSAEDDDNLDSDEKERQEGIKKVATQGNGGRFTGSKSTGD